MTDALATYLHDHLAGSNFGIELLESLRDQHAGQPLAEFAAALLVEVKQDRTALQTLIDQVGTKPPLLKEASVWLAEKFSRMKLTHDASGELGTFEALEALSLGILGKRALFRALAIAAAMDARVRDIDLNEYAERAQSQWTRVEEQRLQVARAAFAPARE